MATSKRHRAADLVMSGVADMRTGPTVSMCPSLISRDHSLAQVDPTVRLISIFDATLVWKLCAARGWSSISAHVISNGTQWDYLDGIPCVSST